MAKAATPGTPGEITAAPSGEAPKMFKIAEPADQIKCFRVSKDAVIAAVALGTDDIHIYRVRPSYYNSCSSMTRRGIS